MTIIRNINHMYRLLHLRHDEVHMRIVCLRGIISASELGSPNGNRKLTCKTPVMVRSPRSLMNTLLISASAFQDSIREEVETYSPRASLTKSIGSDIEEFAMSSMLLVKVFLKYGEWLKVL